MTMTANDPLADNFDPDVHVHWEGPLTVDEALDLRADQDRGLYQFYDDHPVYGAGVLLYLGQTERQTFARRIAQHNWPRWIPSPTALYVGRLCGTGPVTDLELKRQIDFAENLLLFSHSPALNSSCLNSVATRDRYARVFNWGRRKSLLPEVSVARWEGGLTVGHDLPGGPEAVRQRALASGCAFIQARRCG